MFEPIDTVEEKLRVDELAKYEVVYDEPEEEFTQIAQLAVALTMSPIGGMSLVDDRNVWLKARVGVSANCLSRDQAFCSYAVESNRDLFVVSDAKHDQRFSNNPLVHEPPNIRFYAAATLTGQGGYRLGTLWVMDKKPRTLSEDEERALQSLGALAVRLLELRYRNRLTHLANRRAFISNLQCALNQQMVGSETCRIVDCARRSPDGECTSLLLNVKVIIGFVLLQNLHLINIAYGNEAGKQALKALAERLRAWAESRSMVAHLEGDNFSFALFTDPTSRDTPTLNSLEELLAAPVKINDQLIQLRCSIGASFYPSSGTVASALLEQAAAAATQTQELALSAVKTYDPRYWDETLKLITFRRNIANELSEGRFTPHYQAKVDAVAGRVIGFEALARMYDANQQLVGAQHFVPLAEKTGHIRHIDLAILESVCRDLARWRSEGLQTLPVAINLSRATLVHEETLKSIRDMLDAYSIPVDMVEFEITEYGLTDEPKLLCARVDDLHSLGVKVAVDDFGTGLSNLSMLRTYPVDRLKADRIYVHGASTNVHVGGILRLIISVAQLFELDLICEGIEREEDVAWVISAGCHQFQGWYFHRASDANDAARILQLGADWDRGKRPKNHAALAMALAKMESKGPGTIYLPPKHPPVSRL